MNNWSRSTSTTWQEFGLDKPLWQQFFIYVGNVFQGDLGTSFAQYPASVNTLIAQALPWSIAIHASGDPHRLDRRQPARRSGRVQGRLAGPGRLHRVAVPLQRPAVCAGHHSAVPGRGEGGILPVGGAYSFGLTPEFSLAFFGDAITYWWLPFWSLVLVFIGGQAVGMRSMAIYELGSDYVNYNRGLGVKEGHTVRYIFRNAMLPQFTGLALSIAAIITGGLITELVFSYPGLGSLLFSRHRPERLPGDFGDHSVDHDRRAHCQPRR